MRGITVLLGAIGKAERGTVRRAPDAGRSTGRPGRRLALRGGLAVTVPAVLAVALAVPATALTQINVATSTASRAIPVGSGAHGLVVTPAAQSSPAGPIVSGYRSTKCAVISGGSDANDTPVVIADCDGSAAQDWTTEAGGTIQAAGKCLDIYRDEKTNKAPVELWTCTGGANQQWTPDNGTLVNPVSGKCLDDPRFNVTDGTQLEIYTCNGGANQQWNIPSAAPAKVWDLTTDFASHPELNPAPDQYGDSGVWSWEYGTGGQQDTYRLDTPYNSDSACHVENIYTWADGGSDPFVTYNSGPTIVRICGFAENWDSHTIIVSPGAESEGTGALDSIIGWKSPITGEVTVSGSIEGLNTYEPGITWELYRGAENLAGPITESNNQLSTIGPMSVTVDSGQSLYLEIGAGGTSGDYDDCALTFTITS
jgi:hypothetical protein